MQQAGFAATDQSGQYQYGATIGAGGWKLFAGNVDMGVAAPTGKEAFVAVGTEKRLRVSGTQNTFLGAVASDEGFTFTGNGQTLAEYEEGLWTPQWQFDVSPPSSIDYNFQEGRYLRMGNTVFVQAHLSLGSVTWAGASGFMAIGPLPFVPQGSSSEHIFAGTVSWADRIDLLSTSHFVWAKHNLSSLFLGYYQDNAPMVFWNDTNTTLNSNARIAVNAWYTV